MTRARNITPRQTTARAERLRTLITSLLDGNLDRDAIGNVLQVGPSGVRKYLIELGSMLQIVGRIDGTATTLGIPVYGLAITAEAAREYLASLAANPPARPRTAAKPAQTLVVPGRRFHILYDDTHYPIRVSRAPAMRDPLVAALFGAGRHEVRV